MHNQMSVREAAVDRPNSIYGEYVAGRLVLKLVSAVRSADSDRKRIALRLVDKASRLVGIGQ
jgi:hypothetical protein